MSLLQTKLWPWSRSSTEVLATMGKEKNICLTPFSSTSLLVVRSSEKQLYG